MPGAVEEKTAPKSGAAGEAMTRAAAAVFQGPVACHHCGEPGPDPALARDGKVFCCAGCLAVHDLLLASGLDQFYQLSERPGVRVQTPPPRKRWACLDEPEVQQRLLDFTDGNTSRVTFHIPAIHCIACVWLLENLYRLHPGIAQSRVNFPRREVAIAFAPKQITLSELVALLASLGYEPVLTLGALDKPATAPVARRLWLQVGLAGFAFGNIMLFSLPVYFGLDSFSGLLFERLFGWLSLALALPVVVFSAGDYWRSAWRALRQRALPLDVPIALGMAALYGRSVYEVAFRVGPGYCDSLTGLIFFLLLGRVFQQKTYDPLAFDHDYRSFFPLAVIRQTAAGEESVALSAVRVGDRLRLRHGELIPADARLLGGPAVIDYSFVTGESEPVPKQPGDYLYAGGHQTGGAIEVEVVKPVSQSYLTSLWNHEAFQKGRENPLDTLTNRYSRYFTGIVIAIAVGAALFWALRGELPRGLQAFTAVLIVACPCALALAAPFTLGTAQRLLARRNTFLKNPHVLERMALATAIVFDKTGTLTATRGAAVRWQGAPLSPEELSRVRAVARLSTHPLAVRIGATFDAQASELNDLGLIRDTPGEFSFSNSPCARTKDENEDEAGAIATSPRSASGTSRAPAETCEAFEEHPGQGIAGRVAGHEIWLGSRAWFESRGVRVTDFQSPATRASYPPHRAADPTSSRSAGNDPAGDQPVPPEGSSVHVALDGQYRGAFVVGNVLRPEADRLLRELGTRYELALLSGDHARERERFREWFGADARLQFNQSPWDKLGFIRRLQEAGHRVVMVGDGLNDAGALRQSDVGVAVVERIGVFSPASDVIVEAGEVPRLGRTLRFARQAVGLVRAGIGLSALYNVVGISVAAAGLLSPVLCAVLMPISSVSVVTFAVGAARRAGRALGPESGNA